ncbi:MAG TPA: molybdopterin-binding protein [Defluviicoccus sp.]|nr:molybdopterin-binding protein [Defluviicoccus sp.]
MNATTPPTAAVIVIGNEVLSGRTQDRNLVFLAERLAALGIPVAEARVIRDEEAAIIAAVDICRATYTYVFTTGGIGPTHDDITSAAIARAFGVPLLRDPRAVGLLQQHYATDQLNDARLKMANIPQGADLLDNPVSRAPGFRLGNVFVLPGVPAIMRAMFDGLAPTLKGGPPVIARTISAFTTEGAIAQPLGEIQAQHPAVEIGSYPFVRAGRLGVSLVVRATDRAAVAAAGQAVSAMLAQAGAEPIEE